MHATCAFTPSCPQPETTQPSPTHQVSGLERPHVAPHLEHCAAALAAGHKRQSRLFLVLALLGRIHWRGARRVRKGKSRQESTSAGQQARQGRDTRPGLLKLHGCISQLLHAATTMEAMLACSCSASAKLRAAADTLIRTAHGGSGDTAGTSFSRSAPCGLPSASVGWPSFSHTRARYVRAWPCCCSEWRGRGACC